MFHSKYLIKTFWASIVVFGLILLEFFIPPIRNLFKNSILFLLIFIVFSFLGLVLIFLTLKEKLEPKLKKFLLLTGISSASFFIAVLLHNVFYGLAMLVSSFTLLSYFLGLFHLFFFLIAIFISPTLFLIGAIKVIIILRRQPKNKEPSSFISE